MAVATVVIPLVTMLLMGVSSGYPGMLPISVPMIGIIGAASWVACFLLASRIWKKN